MLPARGAASPLSSRDALCAGPAPAGVGGERRAWDKVMVHNFWWLRDTRGDEVEGRRRRQLFAPLATLSNGVFATLDLCSRVRDRRHCPYGASPQIRQKPRQGHCRAAHL